MALDGFCVFLDQQLWGRNISAETHGKATRLYENIISRFPTLGEPPASAGPDGIVFFKWTKSKERECDAVLSFTYAPKTGMWEAYFYQSVIPELSSELYEFADEIPAEVLEILEHISKRGN